MAPRPHKRTHPTKRPGYKTFNGNFVVPEEWMSVPLEYLEILTSMSVKDHQAARHIYADVAGTLAVLRVFYDLKQDPIYVFEKTSQLPPGFNYNDRNNRGPPPPPPPSAPCGAA